MFGPIKNKKEGFFLFIFFVFFLSLSKMAHAFVAIPTFDLLDSGDWQVSVLDTQGKGKPRLTAQDQGSLSNSSLNLIPSSQAEIETEENYNINLAQVSFKPHEGFIYSLRFGLIHQYQLSFSSGSTENQLDSTEPGLAWGLGLHWNLEPSTLVSLGTTIDLEYQQALVQLDRFSSANVQPVDERFQQDQFSGTMTFNHRWGSFQPFGGISVLKLYSHLVDESSKTRMRGSQTELTPFLGMEWEPFKEEKIFFEGSLLKEKSLTVGMSLNF